jgi:SAM-dependent methyltransferase
MIVDPKFYILADMIRKELPKGRDAIEGESLPRLGAVVAMAGDGDHLEIGTGFGASAIMAALVKNEFNLGGKIYCIDPYPKQEGKEDALQANIEALNENAVYFKVAEKLTLIPNASYPFPADLKDKLFVSGFIDGNHDGMAPWLDFLSVRGVVKKFLCFGGVEEFYPGVMVAALRALSIGGWILHWKDGNFISLRRPVDFSDWPKLSNVEKAKRRQASQV